MFEPKKIFEAEVHSFRSTRDRPDMLWSDATPKTKRWYAQQAAINVDIQMAAHAATSGRENAYILFQNPPFTKSVYSGKYTTDVTEPLSLSRIRDRNPNNFSKAKTTWLENLMKRYSLNPSWSKTRQIQALSLMNWADSIEENGNTIQADTESRKISQDDASAKDSHISLTPGKESINRVTKVDITTQDDAIVIKDSTSATFGKGEVGKITDGKTTQGSQPNLPVDDTELTDTWKKRKCETDSVEAKKKPRSISNESDMESIEVVVFRAKDVIITKEDRAWINNEERQQRLIEARRREAEIKNEVEKARHWKAETRKRKNETCHEPEAETKKRMLESSHQRQPESNRRPETFHQRQPESNRRSETFHQSQSESNRRPETFHQMQSELYRSAERFHQRQSEPWTREHETFYQPAMYYRSRRY